MIIYPNCIDCKYYKREDVLFITCEYYKDIPEDIYYKNNKCKYFKKESRGE